MSRGHSCSPMRLIRLGYEVIFACANPVSNLLRDRITPHLPLNAVADDLSRRLLRAAGYDQGTLEDYVERIRHSSVRSTRPRS